MINMVKTIYSRIISPADITVTEDRFGQGNSERSDRNECFNDISGNKSVCLVSVPYG